MKQIGQRLRRGVNITVYSALVWVIVDLTA